MTLLELQDAVRAAIKRARKEKLNPDEVHVLVRLEGAETAVGGGSLDVQLVKPSAGPTFCRIVADLEEIYQ